MATKKYIIFKDNIVDNLTTADSGSPLSANQGKVLKETIDRIPSPSGTLKNNVCAVYKNGEWKLSPDYGYMDVTEIIDGSIVIERASETGSYHWYNIGSTTETPIADKEGTISISIPDQGTIYFSYSIWESDSESGVFYISKTEDNINPVIDEDNPVAARINSNTGEVSGAAIAELEANVKLGMINSVDTLNENYIPEISIEKVKGLKSKLREFISATPLAENDGIIYSVSGGNWVTTRNYGSAEYETIYTDMLSNTMQSWTGNIKWEKQVGAAFISYPKDGDLAKVSSSVYGEICLDVFTLDGDTDHVYIGKRDEYGDIIIWQGTYPFAIRANIVSGLIEYAAYEINSYDATIEISSKVNKFWKGYIPNIDISMVNSLESELNDKASTTDLVSRQATADRVSEWQETPDTTHYPCEKLVKDSLDGKEPTIVQKNTAFNKNFGTESDTVCEGNDSRLSDSRTPTSHATTHGNDGSDRITIDSSQIVSGVIDSSHIPSGSFQKLITVADEAARKALTPTEVSKGDTVKQNDTGVMYFCVDTTKLSTDEGWMVYTAITNWDSVSSKPSSFVPSTHASTHNIDGTDPITTASSTASGLLTKDDWNAFNGKQEKHIPTAIKLEESSWDESTKTQQVSVSGVTSSNTIFVSPEPDSVTAYGIAGVVCIMQTTDSLTFRCNTIPTTNMTVNVVIFN